jgi:mono/diheme cytochrome c family protein
MKTNLKNFVRSAGVLVGIIALFSFIVIQDQKAGGPWEIPAKYKAMKNPSKGDASSVKVGKLMYAKYCKSCHGSMGEGDGPKASSMKTKIESFKDSKFQAQTDGEIYYQTIKGRDDMPAFEKKLVDDEDRWAVVNYVRTLK